LLKYDIFEVHEMIDVTLITDKQKLTIEKGFM